MAPRFILSTLGELRLVGPEGEVRSLRKKERVLLVYLARHGAGSRRAELAALLWGERGDARASHSLRQALSRMQHALPGILAVDARTVRLWPGMVRLDVTTLEEDVRAGRAAAACAHWQGEFLAELEDLGEESLRGWIEAERAGVRRLMERALDALLVESDASGEWGAAVETVHRWARAHPWDEGAQVRLIEALRRAGRDVEAAKWHARTVAQLRADLGVEPSADLLRLGQELVSSHRPATPRRGPLGEAEAQALLLRSWREAAVGTGAVACIVSESPAAPSRLCDTLVAAVADAQTPVLILHAAAADPPPMQAWEIAARLLRNLRSAPGLSGADDGVLAEVARLVPAIRERFPGLPEAPGGDDAIGGAIRQVLADVAAEIPILMILDGFAAADAETRRWLTGLAIELPSCMLLVTTHTRTDADGVMIARAPGAIRLELAGRDAEPTADSAVTWTPPEPAGVPRAAGRAGARRRWLLAAGATALLAAVVTVLDITESTRGAPVLVVGAIAAMDIPPGDPAAAALPEILSSQLARTDGMEVLSRARMQELLARTDGELAAARAARARQLLQGELYRDGRSGYRLELRHIDVGSGRVRRAHTIQAVDVLQLAHQAATAVARTFSLAPPPELEGFHSVRARAFYEEGLTALYAGGDSGRAFGLFTAALREDSTFAMAAFQAMGATSLPDSFTRYFRWAEALASAAPDRDRLIIETHLAALFVEPRALALAETLSIRYPHDPSGARYLGEARGLRGDFLGAVEQYQRAIALDPTLHGATSGTCHACAGYGGAWSAYVLADSGPAAVHWARRWAELQPDQPAPLASLAAALEYLDRYDEASAARRKLAMLRPSDALADLAQVYRYLRTGDFATADRMLRTSARALDSAVAKQAGWFQVLSLRYQGRLNDAMSVAHRHRALYEAGGPSAYALLPVALILQEAGRPTEAAAVLDTMLSVAPDLGRPARNARERAWTLTRLGSALAAAGDTARLARLADSVQLIGAQSGYGRDRRSHHHLRGLLYRARGNHAAAEREFRAAIFSLNMGYTRTNLELAQLLIEGGRPAQAVPLLQAALRGSLDGMPLYVTRTELHEALGHAWDATGRRDSAAHHFQRVRDAWRNADPVFHARRAEVQRRLAVLRAEKSR